MSELLRDCPPVVQELPGRFQRCQKVEWEDVEKVYDLLGLAVPGDYQPVAGALLGWTEIVDCVKSHPSRFFHGPYGFVLQGSQRLAIPVPWRGQRGIFQVPAAAVGSIDL